MIPAPKPIKFDAQQLRALIDLSATGLATQRDIDVLADQAEALLAERDRLQLRCELYERSRARWAAAARREEPLRAEIVPVASAYATVEHEQSRAPQGSRMREVCDAARAYVDMLNRRDEGMKARLVDLRAECDEALELLYEMDECPEGLVAATKHSMDCVHHSMALVVHVMDEKKAIAAEACKLLETIPARMILVGDWMRQRDAFVAKHSVPAAVPAKDGGA